jgi:phage gp46-like protein
MGAGSFPAGLGGAGLDPVYLPTPAAQPLPPRALFYDPRLRQFSLTDALGNQFDVHPVDQIVALRLTSYQGQSTSQTTLGTRLRTISQGLSPDRAQQLAQTEVQRVLQDLIDAGDIRLISVVADVSVYSRTQFAVTYVNLRDPANPLRYPNTTQLNAGSTNGN